MELRIPEGLEGLVATGAICALAIGVLTLAWLAAMVLAPLPASNPGRELADVAGRPLVQLPRFLPTTLVAFAYVPVWLGLAAILWRETPSAALLAAGFGLLYPPLCLIAYWLQFTVVRGLADLWREDPAAATAAYEVVGFHERGTSASGTLAVLGYTLWGVAGLAAAIGLFRHEGAAAATTAVLYLVTALLALTGAAGHVARHRILEFGVVASGVTSVTATIATAVLFFGAL